MTLSTRLRLPGLLGRFDWAFWLCLCGAMLLPRLYETHRLWQVGSLPPDLLAAIEQFRVVELALEVIAESIPFAVLAACTRLKRPSRVAALSGAALVWVGAAACLLALTVQLIAVPWLAHTSALSPHWQSAAARYLQWRSIGMPFEVMALTLMMALKGMGHGRQVVAVTALTVGCGIFIDALLYGRFNWSLNLGLDGVALGYVLTRAAGFGCALLVWWLACGWPRWRAVRRYLPLQRFLAVGGMTGLDSLLRNAGYSYLLVLINLMGALPIAAYGLAMHLIWLALIPVLALAETLTIAVGQAKTLTQRRQAISSGLAVLALLDLALLALLAFWPQWAAMLNDDARLQALSAQVALWLAVPYLLFTISQCARGALIGAKIAWPIPLSTLLVALLTTLPAAYAVQAGGWVPGMREVLWVMGAGFMVDAAVIWTLCWRRVWLEAPAARAAAHTVYTGVT